VAVETGRNPSGRVISITRPQLFGDLPELFCENHVWLAEAIMPDQTILLVDDEKEILELAASFLGGEF
jgi:hypothetical protein